MASTTRVNLVLMLLVAVLGMALWLSPEPDLSYPPLTALLPTQVERLQLDNRHADGLLIERRDTRWQILHPAPLLADSQRVERLLAIVQAPVLHAQPLPASLQPFGLEPPQARLQLNDLLLEIGNTEPLQHHRYLRIGETLYLIKDIYPQLLFAPPDYYLAEPLEP